MRINKHDTNGIKPLLGKGELGYDDYDVGGDFGRVYVGTGSENIPLAKKSEIDSHVNRIDNPHSVTKTQVGLGNVDNTSDVNKPISTATQTALNLKAPLVSPTLVTPNIGVATGTSFNSITGLSSTTPSVADTAAIGTSTTVARADHVHPVQTSVSGNAGTATKLTTARTISLTGDVTGSVSFDGSSNASITATIAANSVALGTDTTGNYVAEVTAGQGITISGTAGEGWSPTIALSALDLTLFPTSNFKKSVKVATTANITLSGVQTIDGISVVSGDRVLVKNQTTASQNGIYIVNASTWTRSVAADGANEIDSAVVGVDQGTTNGGRFFTNTFKTTDTVGTTAMPWYEVATTSSTVSSANTLATARTISGVSFNGSANIDIEDRLGTAIASAATTTVGTIGLGDYIHITGTTTITSLGTAAAAGIRRTLIFDGALTLTHNATSLICPGAANIVTVAGTIIEVVAETTANWRVVSITHPSLSMAELGYLDGVTSAIQTQLNAKAALASPALTGTPTAPTAAVGTNTTQLATTAYVVAEVTNETYSKTQLNNGQLDNRYFTEIELLNGALDVRYYTETEIDAKLAAQNDASEISVTPTGNLVSTNVQAALVELQGDIDNRYTKAQTDTLLAGRAKTAVYQGSYGLEWNETTDTYRRIGAADYTAIQSMMRRCVLNSDGSVNYYLDNNNSNLREDGKLAVLDGTDGNVMVEVPKTYVRYEYTTIGGAGTDTVHRWEISLDPETGFEPHWAFDRGGSIRSKRYYPAYQGYVNDGKLISRSGVYPTTNVTLSTFRVYSKANSVTNPSTGETPYGYWSNIDFALYELITLLCVIEYGTMNIQSALGRGRTALTGGTWVGGSLIGVTGLSNSYGNRTANYTYAGSADDANADLSFMSYRGCENFFGNVWRMTDGVIFKGTTNNKTMWYSTNPASYNNDATGYTNSGTVTASASGYGRKLGNTNKGFIVTNVTGGNSNAGTTDYFHTSTTDSTLALVGGSPNNVLASGPLDLIVGLAAASAANASYGCGVSF